MFSAAIRRRGIILGLIAGTMSLGACGGDPPQGPDALKPEVLQLYLVNNQALPFKAYDTGFGGSVWIAGARLESAEAGRSVDPRIFEDRSGNGQTGGSSRDSTTAAAKMQDVREFEERSASGQVVGRKTDISPVTVERRGDLLLIIRTHPDPARQFVDTGYFVNGSVRVAVREWERFAMNANSVQFFYATSN